MSQMQTAEAEDILPPISVDDAQGDRAGADREIVNSVLKALDVLRVFSRTSRE